jgi:hypothetical protein
LSSNPEFRRNNLLIRKKEFALSTKLLLVHFE